MKKHSKTTSAPSRLISEMTETMDDLHKAGVVSNRRLAEFKETCRTATGSKPAKPHSVQVTLKPSLAAVFPDSKSVNEALDLLVRLTKPLRKVAM